MSVINFWIDEFNRADSTTIGMGWLESSGNWTISSNALVAPMAAGNLIYNNVEIPASGDYTISCDVTFTYSEGQTPYISLVARLVDASNYYFFQFGGGASSIVIVGFNYFGGAGGIGSAVGVTCTSGTKYNLKAVLSGTSLKLYLDNVLKCNVTDPRFGIGKFGFRVDGTTGSVAIDKFTFDGMVAGDKLQKFRRTRSLGLIKGN